MLERAAAIHVTSRREEREIEDIAPGVPRVVIPNMVLPPRNTGNGEEFRRRFLRGASAPVVLSLGRLSRRKSLDVVIRAFARGTLNHPDSQLVLAGPDDEGITPSLMALSNELGIVDRIVFTGMLHGEEKLAAFAAADVFVTASMAENFGLALVEAMASGVPPVVSASIDIAPEIAAAGAGRVASPTVEELAIEIEQLLTDAEKRATMSTAARHFAHQYEPAYVAPRLVELYETVARRVVT